MSRRRNRGSRDARYLPPLEDDYLPVWVPEKGRRNPERFEAPRGRPLPQEDAPAWCRDRYEHTEIHQGDRYTLTQISIHIDGSGKKRVPNDDELFEEILRKRNGGGWR